MSPAAIPPPDLPCADPACAETVKASMLACPKDWHRLPTSLRHAVGRAWQDRCAGKPGSTTAHIAAKRAAVDWYRRNPK